MARVQERGKKASEFLDVVLDNLLDERAQHSCGWY